MPPLGTGERPIKDVRVSGEAVSARLAGATAGAVQTTQKVPAASGVAIGNAGAAAD